MLQRTADVPTAARKRGVCESDYAALNMGLFVMNAVLGAVSSASVDGVIAENKLQCVGANNQTYTCDSGHCCGESQCCSYYYELWWFWLVWTVIIILSCCCVCHHRRAKHRLQQQQRQHEINLIAYREVNNYSSLPFYLRFLPSYLLPAYEEVENRPPTPPPPYSPAQAGQGGDAPSPEQPEHLHRPSLQSGPTPPCDSAESDPSGGCLEEPRHPNLHFQGTAVTTVTATGRKPYLSFAPDVSQSQVACATSPESTKRGVCCKENPKSEEQAPDCCPDAKDKTPGRHRRFTGDSGIEVCVCNRGPGEEEEDEMKEYEGLLDGEGLQEQDFCDSCNPHHAGADPQRRAGDEEEEQEQGFVGPEQDPEHRDTPPNLRPPICLHLHTINETEAPHHGNNTEPPI